MKANELHVNLGNALFGKCDVQHSQHRVIYSFVCTCVRMHNCKGRTSLCVHASLILCLHFSPAVSVHRNTYQ